MLVTGHQCPDLIAAVAVQSQVYTPLEFVLFVFELMYPFLVRFHMNPSFRRSTAAAGPARWAQAVARQPVAPGCP